MMADASSILGASFIVLGRDNSARNFSQTALWIYFLVPFFCLCTSKSRQHFESILKHLKFTTTDSDSPSPLQQSFHHQVNQLNGVVNKRCHLSSQRQINWSNRRKSNSTDQYAFSVNRGQVKVGFWAVGITLSANSTPISSSSQVSTQNMCARQLAAKKDKDIL
jgi:hypothetical protein